MFHTSVNGLHLLSHVDLVHHLIALVENENLQVVQNQRLIFHKLQDTTRCADHDVWRGFLQNLHLILNGHTTEEALFSNFWEVCSEPITLFLNLMSQFPGVAEDEHRVRQRFVVKLM